MQKALKKAAQKGAKVSIIYVSQSGAVSKRVIYIISWTDERIVGYCYMRKNIRTFKINNILAIERATQKMEVYA